MRTLIIYYVYETDGITYNNWDTAVIRLHYNWEWGTGSGNGWYYSGATQPEGSSRDYQYGRENLFISF